MDIQITPHMRHDKVNICAISPAGVAWVFKNIEMNTVVVVDKESIGETIASMQKDGLTVSER